MIRDHEIERVLRQELKDLIPNAIWKNDNGVYEVFGHYRIIPERPGYRVHCAASDIGSFNSTRSALSWCIADKYQNYNLARQLFDIDQKLGYLNNDIAIRAAIADRSNRTEFRDEIGTKLETKIIHKKQLENELAKCVNWAKYCQHRGFDNETARTGRGQPNKTNR